MGNIHRLQIPVTLIVTDRDYRPTPEELDWFAELIDSTELDASIAALEAITAGIAA